MEIFTSGKYQVRKLVDLNDTDKNRYVVVNTDHPEVQEFQSKLLYEALRVCKQLPVELEKALAFEPNPPAKDWGERKTPQMTFDFSKVN